MPKTVVAEKLVRATPTQVYYSFTRASALTEWMCDFATLAPRSGGRIYLWWREGFYSAGEFISLVENKSIVFKWHARQDPCPSQVAVTLEGKGDGTLVTLVHTFPEGDYWSENAKRLQEEWTRTLDNLAQVLETGLDKRAFDRPMLGINLSDFNADIAKAMGVPVKEGMRLDNLPEEMGAYKAGLRKDDVLVSLCGQPVTNDFNTLLTVMQGKHVGDRLEAVFYRGSEKLMAMVELSGRPVPKIPWDAAGLTKTTRAKYDEALAALEKAFAGVSEAEANLQPAAGEWSANETLAHLIHNERHWLENLDDAIGGYPRLSDDWAGNGTTHARATVAAYKTTRGLLDEMKHLADEMVAYTSTLPDEFIARKASYFQIANMLLDGSLPHITSHIDQIEKAISAARKKK
jgi:uncharacterized protein YndB with AHSA1/START domain/uncharacterized damage-inducible protein DinB